MKVLIVSGFDPSGAAGLVLDLRVLSALEVCTAAVPSALTVQTVKEALSWDPVPGSYLRRSLSATLSGQVIKVIKIGMLGNEETALAVAEVLSSFAGPVVFDPVLYASSGLELTEKEALPVIREGILPRTALFTPNLPEAEVFLGKRIPPGEEVEAVRALRALGPRAVLLKGGHREAPEVRDLFFDGDQLRVFSRPRLARSFRGTGCFLSSAVAGFLARGLSLSEAVARAEEFLSLGLLAASSNF